MKSCFMFGHRDYPDSMLPEIEKTIEEYYTTYGVRWFYVGNRGNFDRLGAMAVKKMKKKHADINLFLLLAYHPSERAVVLSEGFDNSFYPPMETVPKQYTIVKANQYMIDNADTILCYVVHFGNARNLMEYAKKGKRQIICTNIAENNFMQTTYQ